MTATGKRTHRQCFDRNLLEDFALGRLPVEEAERIATEVEACPRCQARLNRLDDLEDSVIADLKTYAGSLPLGSDLVQRLRKAEQISRVAWDVPKVVPAEEPLPDRLGQYEIVAPIGRGGMGTVYKALHTRLKRMVAIKVLARHRTGDPQALARFQREMEAVGQLDHPHLVRAHDAGEADGRHFLVMEFLNGVDLARVVRDGGPLSVADACKAIHQAALGVEHAHEHGLIHRDLKPSNLMLTVDGHVKVLDLGLARLTDETFSLGDMTSAGQIVGTGDFIAPEQGQDARKADARSDVYSLGCTFFFLLAGCAPFSDPSYDTLIKKVLAHGHEPLPSIRSIRDEVPPSLAALLERMLAKKADDRPQTAGEVVETLAPFARGADLAGLVTRRSSPDTTSPRSSTACISARRSHPFAAVADRTAHRSKAKHFGRAMVIVLVTGLVLTSLGAGWWSFVLPERPPGLPQTAPLFLPGERDGGRPGVLDEPRIEDTLARIPQPSTRDSQSDSARRRRESTDALTILSDLEKEKLQSIDEIGRNLQIHRVKYEAVVAQRQFGPSYFAALVIVSAHAGLLGNHDREALLLNRYWEEYVRHVPPSEAFSFVENVNRIVSEEGRFFQEQVDGGDYGPVFSFLRTEQQAEDQWLKRALYGKLSWPKYAEMWPFGKDLRFAFSTAQAKGLPFIAERQATFHNALPRYPSDYLREYLNKNQYVSFRGKADPSLQAAIQTRLSILDYYAQIEHLPEGLDRFLQDSVICPLLSDLKSHGPEAWNAAVVADAIPVLRLLAHRIAEPAQREEASRLLLRFNQSMECCTPERQAVPIRTSPSSDAKLPPGGDGSSFSTETKHVI